jgi:hypothetical protein
LLLSGNSPVASFVGLVHSPQFVNCDDNSGRYQQERENGECERYRSFHVTRGLLSFQFGDVRKCRRNGKGNSLAIANSRQTEENACGSVVDSRNAVHIFVQNTGAFVQGFKQRRSRWNWLDQRQNRRGGKKPLNQLLQLTPTNAHLGVVSFGGVTR